MNSLAIAVYKTNLIQREKAFCLENRNNVFHPIPEEMRKVMDALNRTTMLTDQITSAMHMASQMADCATLAANFSVDNSPAMQAVKNAEAIYCRLPELSATVQNVISTTDLALQSESPFLNWMNSFDVQPWTQLLSCYQPQVGTVLDIKLYDETLLQEMYNARWIPTLAYSMDIDTVIEINKILASIRASKKRVKQIDSIIFKFCTKSWLERLRKSWRNCGVPKYMLRILNQAVQAYYRKEYVLTVSTLATLWEGIIARKSGFADEFRSGKKVHNELNELIHQNGYEEIIGSFCSDFIFYQCTKPGDVKQDVPGRHSICHAWYDKYPNQKMALNAILFTDLLLRLDSSVELSDAG